MIKINLEKVEERWWESVLVDEPKISVRKIDPSRPITDLDDEAQAKIEELMYNEQQKRLGLPQSHEKVGSTLCMYLDKEGTMNVGCKQHWTEYIVSCQAQARKTLNLRPFSLLACLFEVSTVWL